MIGIVADKATAAGRELNYTQKKSRGEHSLRTTPFSII